MDTTKSILYENLDRVDKSYLSRTMFNYKKYKSGFSTQKLLNTHSNTHSNTYTCKIYLLSFSKV
jgi:hypothetical protein